MSTYVPDFESQRDEGLKPPLTNCNPASNAMLIDWWTYGGIDTSDVLLRQASGIGPAVGMNFRAVDKAIRALYGAQLGGLLFSEANGSGNRQLIWKQLLAHFDAGGGAVLCGFYKDLPSHYRRWSSAFSGGHAAYVQGTGPGPRRWFDPLAAGDASYEGEPINDDVLWNFIWTAGSTDAAKNFVTAAHGFLAPRAEPARFSDIGPGDSFYADVVWAADAGLLAGVGGGRFAPDVPLTRAQAAAVLRRFDRYLAKKET